MVAKTELSRVNHLEPTPVADLGKHCGRIGVFSVWVSDHTVTVTDDSVKQRRRGGELCARTVMTVDTHTQQRCGVRYRVMNYTRMDHRYRGCGIAPRVYEIVAARTGPIMSGSAQSAGGRSIWNTITKRSRLTVAALWRRQIWAVEPGWGEVDCEHFDVYNTNSRLIAV